MGYMGSSYNIPKDIFYLLKGDCRGREKGSRAWQLGFRGQRPGFGDHKIWVARFCSWGRDPNERYFAKWDP